MPDPTPYETFSQPALLCPKCHREIPVKVWRGRAGRYRVPIGCERCAKAVKPPGPKAPAKKSEQTSFMDTGTIRVE